MSLVLNNDNQSLKISCYCKQKHFNGFEYQHLV